MFKNTSNRTDQAEWMDEPEICEKDLANAYKDINHVNTFLGGNKITLKGIIQLEKLSKTKHPIRIIDIGCGDGSTLKFLAKFARKNNKNWLFSGVDINPKSIKLAQKNTLNFPKINYIEANVFSENFKKLETDIFILTLTLHHFKDKEIMSILESSVHQARLGLVINDLQRSSLAYTLFQLYGYLFLKSAIARHDGLVSILRGFKKKELIHFSKKCLEAKHSIQYKWAFRWLWIIKKI